VQGFTLIFSKDFIKFNEKLKEKERKRAKNNFLPRKNTIIF